MILPVILMLLLSAGMAGAAPWISEVWIAPDSPGGDHNITVNFPAEITVHAIVCACSEPIEDVYADVGDFTDHSGHPLDHVQLKFTDSLGENCDHYKGRFIAMTDTDGYQPIPVYATDELGTVSVDRGCLLAVRFKEPREVCSTPVICDLPLLSALLILAGIFIASAIYARRKR